MKKRISQKKDKGRKKKNISHDPVIESMLNVNPSKSDPTGSWTGKPMDINERPIQDADDL